MRLREFLFRKRLSQQDFAKLSGLSQKTISSAVTQKEITLENAKLIEKITEGLVKCHELGPQEKEEEWSGDHK